MTETSYEQFLAGKVDFRSDFGFEVDEDEINCNLLPHQRPSKSRAGG